MTFERRKTLRSCKQYIAHIPTGHKFRVGLKLDSAIHQKLSSILNIPLCEGDSFVPSAALGSNCRKNSLGIEIVRKDLPKVSKFLYSKEWSWKLYDGTEESKIVDVYRDVYQRERMPGMELPLTFVKKNNHMYVIIEEELTNTEENYPVILMALNLFVDIFQKFDVFNEELVVPMEVKMLNWEILQSGTLIATVIKRMNLGRLSKNQEELFHHRFNILRRNNPQEEYIGVNGYSGYTVFYFPHKNIYIFDSLKYGNATYIFDSAQDWKLLSQQNKQYILSKELYKTRLVHNAQWENEINKIFR